MNKYLSLSISLSLSLFTSPSLSLSVSLYLSLSNRETGPRCPVDNTRVSNHQLFKDNFAKREVLSLNVCCSAHEAGCKWQGELRDLEVCFLVHGETYCTCLLHVYIYVYGHVHAADTCMCMHVHIQCTVNMCFLTFVLFVQPFRLPSSLSLSLSLSLTHTHTHTASLQIL